MIVRVRGPSGTARVECTDADTVAVLKSKIQAATGIPAGEQVLSTTPGGDSVLSNDSTSLKAAKIAHGAMLYLMGGKARRRSADKHDRRVAACKHGANATCIHCLPTDGKDAPTGKAKCDHPEGVVCTNCQKKSKAKGKNLDWLCSHGPETTCVNCMKQPKKNKESKKRAPCTHPASMRCSNCRRASSERTGSSGRRRSSNSPPKSRVAVSGRADGKPLTAEQAAATAAAAPVAGGSGQALGGAGASAGKGKGARTVLTRWCKHGPNGMCAHCMPKADEKKKAVRICRNHGFNGSCTECIAWREAQKVSIKAQAAPHTSAVSMDYNAANVFQSYILVKQFKLHRYGILFGVVEESGAVRVEAVYEPRQSNSGTGVEFTWQDDERDKAESIAAMLGLQPVGWIFSRNRSEYVLSPSEVETAARLQSKYGKHFVSVVITPTKSKQVQFEAFQMSDQTVDLVNEDQIVASQNAKTLRVRDVVIIEKAETREIDLNFCLTRVPIKQHRSKIFTSTFPVENREPPLAQSDLKVHMINNSEKPLLARISDFHLLLYLSNYMDVNTDMPGLCDAVRTQSAVGEGYELILNSMAGL